MDPSAGSSPTPTARPRSWLRFVLCCPTPQLSPAVMLSMLGCLAASAPSMLQVEEGTSCLDLDPRTFTSMSDVHRLVTYVFYHKDWNSLFCSCLIIWYFGGGFEQSVGTVKHCYLTIVFTVSSAMLLLAVHAGATAGGMEMKERVHGFTPVVFAMISAFTINSRLRRVLLLGFMIPTKALPLIFLGVSLFIPHASFLGNLCGILVGIAYGLGGCSFLDISETLVTKLDRKFPFSLLRRISALKYIPGSAAERRASQHNKLNPPPGSYPTQQYYPHPTQNLLETPSSGLGHNHMPSQHQHGSPSYQAAVPHNSLYTPGAAIAHQGHCYSHPHAAPSPVRYPSGSWAVSMTNHTDGVPHHHSVPTAVESTTKQYELMGVETH